MDSGQDLACGAESCWPGVRGLAASAADRSARRCERSDLGDLRKLRRGGTWGSQGTSSSQHSAEDETAGWTLPTTRASPASLALHALPPSSTEHASEVR